MPRTTPIEKELATTVLKQYLGKTLNNNEVSKILDTIPKKLLNAPFHPEYEKKFQSIYFPYYLEACIAYKNNESLYKFNSLYPVRQKVSIKFDGNFMYYEYILPSMLQEITNVFTMGDPRIESANIVNIQYREPPPVKLKTREATDIEDAVKYIRDERQAAIFRAYYSKSGLKITTNMKLRLKKKYLLEQLFYEECGLYNSEFYAVKDTINGEATIRWELPANFETRLEAMKNE